jgi:hypothetical protein
MSRVCQLLVLLIVAAPSVAAAQADAPSTRPTFVAGFAERDITPDIGMEQPGNYMKAFHRVRHDACKVRAAVFGDGQTRVAVVGIDTLMIRRPTVQAARQAIAEKTGIAPGAIMVAASHTHAGGPTGMVQPGEYDTASDEVKTLAYEKSSCADAKFLAHVERQIVDAVVEANGKLSPARGSAGYGLEDKVLFNRRFRMKDGLTFTHPGQGNPAIIEPAGPIDGQVGTLGVWDDKGKLVGCVVNYACHATTGPGGTSADYVFYIERAIRGAYGDDVVVVFLAGMAGDVTQVDNRLPIAAKQSGEAASRFVGARVGGEAVKALVTLDRSAGALGPVKFDGVTLKIPRRAPSPEKVAKARELVAKKPGTEVPMTLWVFAKETLMLEHLVKTTPVLDVEVQAIQVGPAVMLSCPAEYFTRYGLELKAGSGFPVTFPVSLANDCVGYVPTLEAFGADGGGYETRLTSYSNLRIEAGNEIRDTLLALAKKLTPGPVPAAPPAPPYKSNPWGYGSVPPEKD